MKVIHQGRPATIPQRLARDSSLSVYAKAAWMILSTWSDPYPSVKTIAKWIPCSEPTAIKALKELATKGWIVKCLGNKRSEDPSDRTTRYEMQYEGPVLQEATEKDAPINVNGLTKSNLLNDINLIPLTQDKDNTEIKTNIREQQNQSLSSASPNGSPENLKTTKPKTKSEYPPERFNRHLRKWEVIQGAEPNSLTSSAYNRARAVLLRMFKATFSDEEIEGTMEAVAELHRRGWYRTKAGINMELIESLVVVYRKGELTPEFQFRHKSNQTAQERKSQQFDKQMEMLERFVKGDELTDGVLTGA